MTDQTIPAETSAIPGDSSLSADSINHTAATVSDAPPEEAAPLPAGFDDLGLHPDVKQALDDMGYFQPTPVQRAVFEPVTSGKDLLVQSRTGTGKTTAFGLPIVNRVVPAVRTPQAMVLCPTRELALQVARELTQLGKHRGVIVEAVYGGAPIAKQIAALKDGVHVIVGTPGRVLDHIGRRTLDCRTIATFVLDECDEMLSMGFLEDIERVTATLPEKHQTLLFSATMPDEVARYARRHMKAAENLSLSRDSVSVADIHHAYYIVSGIARSRDLLKIIYAEQPESAIIFCNLRDETTTIAKFLNKQGLDAEPLSSDLSQADRERVMNRMKAKNLRFLCATDVAARGIDISDLSHVINFSVPEQPEVYVHRTGRTGRAGRKGTALSLVGPRELGNFRYVKLQFGIKPEERLLPKDDIFVGRLKVPLPPVGSPQPPDPVQILIRGVPQTPSDLERQIFEKLVSTANGKRVLAQLVAEKLNALSTRTAPRNRVADQDGARHAMDQRPTDSMRGAAPDSASLPPRGRESSFGNDRPQRFGRSENTERDQATAAGERSSERRDRPRFGDGERDNASARLRGSERGERGDRDRSDRDRGDRNDRDRSDRDRADRTDRDRSDRDRSDRDRGDRNDRDRSDRDRADRDRSDRDRGDRDRGDRNDRDRSGGDRDRNERDRGDRDGGDRDRLRAGELPREDAVRNERPRFEREGRSDRGRPDRQRFDEEAAPQRSERGSGGERAPGGDRSNRDRFDRNRGDQSRFDFDRNMQRDTIQTEVATAAGTEVPAATVDTTLDAAHGQRSVKNGRHTRGDTFVELTPVGASATVDAEREIAAASHGHAESSPAASSEVDRAAKRPREKRATEPSEATREFWETWAETKTAAPPATPATAAPGVGRDESGEQAQTARGERSPRGGRGRGSQKPDAKRSARTAKKAEPAAAEEPSKAHAAARSKHDTIVGSATDDSQARLFVSLGKKHGVSADDLRTLLAGPIGGDRARIGSVSLRDSHAHVRVPEELVDAIISSINGTQHKDHDVTVERSRG